MDYSDLDQMITRLSAVIESDNPEKGYWKGLWSLVGEIRGGFKGTRYPSINEKNEAWKRLEKLIANAEARSTKEKEERERRQREWEQKVAKSEAARDKLASKLGATRPLSALEEMIGTLILAPILLFESMLRDLLGLEQLDRMHEDLKSCSAAMKDAWRFFNESKDAFLPADKHSAYEQLTKAQDRLNRAWDAWKEANGRAHEDRKRQRDQKQHEWRQRVSANIAKLEANIDKAEGALEHQRRHLDKLQGDYDSAWNEGFRDRCRDWMGQARDKISDIEASLDKMRGWVEDERTKLR